MDAARPSGTFRINRSVLKKFGIKVKQSMPGRMRVRVKGLQRKTQASLWMKEHLLQVAGVERVETRFATGSVIIVFDEHATSVKVLLREVLGQVVQPVAYPESSEPVPGFQKLCDSCDCDAQLTFSQKVRRVGWLTAFMAYSAVRIWLFRLPLLQTPFSLIGIAAIAGTLPLVKEAVSDTLEKEKVTVKPFLAFGSIATILMGEAFSALQIIWIYNVAELTEDYVAQKSRKAIREILEVAPAKAYVMVDGMEVETAVSRILPDDIVAVHTGEKIPVDGIVIDGEALVDEASINGRSEAVFHGVDDEVWAGTIVSQGVLFVRTIKTGEDTYLAHIMKMVEDSLDNKAPVEQKADQLAARLLRIGLAATAVTFLLTFDPMRALTVMLVMSCPCATVLAASSAVTASVANAAKNSILIKGGLYLEKVGSTDVYCFDKTGTLTMDQPEIIAVVGRTPSISEDAILTMAATAESHNQHPMAKAILAEASARGIETEPHAVCDFKAGRGVLCTVGGDAVILVGNRQLMEEHEVDIRWFGKKAAAQRQQGNTVVYVAKNGRAQGLLGIANPVRPEAVRVLHCLKGDGVKRIELVTGDNSDVAKSLMDVFPFDDCRADLMPEQKAARVDELQQDRSVVMVGDGVNDAPALAAASVSFAIKGGTDIAEHTANATLMRQSADQVADALLIARATLKNIKQNLFFAFIYNIIGIPLAALGFLTPVIAAAAMMMSSLSVIGNAIRLKWLNVNATETDNI